MRATARPGPVRGLLLLLLALLPACGGLPVPEGVRDAAGVRGEQADAGGIVVVAPGPQPAMTAVELVTAFLYALSRSPQDDHAIARQFLARDVECCGRNGEAILYPLGTRSLSVPEDPTVVRVSYESVGRILPDGSYRLEQRRVRDDFGVVQTDQGLRLSAVPDGLRLLQDDLVRSFTPYDVHFLGRSPDGGASGRLVPDRVFLPVTAEPGQALVDTLLRGPTARLQAAVLTAAPEGLQARVTVDAGRATVDLSGHVRELDSRARQRLAAQLVWTLVPTYSGVRLRVEGEPFPDDGADGVQDRDDWAVYDPAALPSDAALLYVRDRRLRMLDRELQDSPVTTGQLPVDGAAQSPATSQLAVRTRLPSGVDEIRTGPLGGPFGDPVLTAPGLTSLTYGPGDQGLWVLQRGSPAVVWWVPPAGGASGPQQVPHEPPPGSGALTALQVSRDGARIALVFGGRLFVGRVEPVGDGVRIGDILPVSRELAAVTDVAWQDGTSLVALGSFQGEEQLFPAQVAVDGSSFEVVQRPLVGAVAVEVAAAPRRPLVVAADVDGRLQLYRDDGTLFRAQAPGRAPFYPG